MFHRDRLIIYSMIAFIMRVFIGLIILASALAASCNAADTQCRTRYLQATLPYQTYCAYGALVEIRAKTTDSLLIYPLEEILIEDILRIQVCMSDPDVPDSSKKYARDILPKIVSYAKEHNIAANYVPGKIYDMLPDDIVLPPKMAIRDVMDSIIKNY